MIFSHSLYLASCLPIIHPIVDDGVDHGVGHGEPVEGQVKVWDVGAHCHRPVVIGVDEIAMVREPANCEDGYHCDKHPHYLDNQCSMDKGDFYEQVLHTYLVFYLIYICNGEV